jgi:hypothetical protein
MVLAELPPAEATAGGRRNAAAGGGRLVHGDVAVDGITAQER